MPEILFKFNTSRALNVFAKTFAAYISIYDVILELHIELNFAKDLRKEDLRKLGS
jgi:hypothetical protein